MLRMTGKSSLPFSLRNKRSIDQPEARNLTEEIQDFKRLHALSLRLASTNDFAAVLADVLETAVDMVGASFGSAQLITAEGTLRLIAEKGFGDRIFDQFASVYLDDCSTCAVALQRKGRVVVEDLRADPTFTKIAEALTAYGAVAAVSTPVLDSKGEVLAMFSVYWGERHGANDRELRALDLCADLAGRHVERHAAEKALRDREMILMQELAHRGKNLISVVQAIAKHSLNGEKPLDEAREVFIGRLRALGNAYNTLIDETPEGAQFSDIVLESLNVVGARVAIDGEPLIVPAKIAQTLSLVFHELTTNAAKHGALSNEQGRIKVAWNILTNDRQEDRFRLVWSETGGPPAQSPAQTSFGTAIITSVIGSELGCEPRLEFTSDGFRYELECSLGRLTNFRTSVDCQA